MVVIWRDESGVSAGSGSVRLLEISSNLHATAFCLWSVHFWLHYVGKHLIRSQPVEMGSNGTAQWKEEIRYLILQQPADICRPFHADCVCLSCAPFHPLPQKYLPSSCDSFWTWACMSLSAPIESDVHTTYLTNAEEEANKFKEFPIWKCKHRCNNGDLRYLMISYK